MFDKIAKSLPLISIAVFLLSYSYLSAYYGEFNINVSVFFNYSEIFYALLPLVILMFSSGLSVMVNASTPSISKVQKGNSFSPTSSLDNKIKSKKFKWRYLIAASIFILEILLRRIFGLFRDIPTVSVVPFIILGFITAYDYKKLKQRNVVLDTEFQLVALIYVGFICNQYAHEKANVIKVLGSTLQVSFKDNNKLVKSSDTFFPIGETENYLFFYNRLDSSSTVFKRTELDSLVYKGSY